VRFLEDDLRWPCRYRALDEDAGAVRVVIAVQALSLETSSVAVPAPSPGSIAWAAIDRNF
jgi:hypothetical protein